MIDLPALEAACYGRRPDRAAQVASALRALANGEAPERDLPRGYTRLAGALASALGDPRMPLTETEARDLVVRNGVAVPLLAASAFGGGDFALAAMGGVNLGGEDPSKLIRQLAVLSLDTELEFEPEALLGLPPALGLLAALNAVAQSPVLSVRGAARRDRLLELAERWPQADLPATLGAVSRLTAAWLSCSYADTPRRHGAKPVLNRIIQRLNARLGLHGAALPPSRARPERPTMVVAAEVIHTRHVQFRYFGQYLRQLRRRFQLVLVANRIEVDATIQSLFDEIRPFDWSPAGAHFAAIRAAIVGAAPDILFYPSVGMSDWGPLIANLRLAPIQATALGHSASTFIPAMDYYVLEAGYVSDPSLFSETLIALPDESLRFERPPGWTRPLPQVRAATPDPVKIAVPSNMLKLNPGFLATLARVAASTTRALEFHLLPNAAVLQTEALRRALARSLPGAIVYPRLPQAAYADVLNNCDLVLSPFPFGGLHSVVDALAQGLPVVAMEGAEPHARTDAMLIRRLGLPEALIAQDAAGYEAAALRLIQDDDWRLELSRQALACEVDRQMFADAASPLRGEVEGAFWAMFRDHERLRANGRRLWRLDELEQLGA